MKFADFICIEAINVKLKANDREGVIQELAQGLLDAGPGERWTIKVEIDMKKPKPLNPEPPRKICPVCGEPSYSRVGIHPQCASVQADIKRVREAKEAAKSQRDEEIPPPDDLDALENL